MHLAVLRSYILQCEFFFTLLYTGVPQTCEYPDTTQEQIGIEKFVLKILGH